LTAGTDTALAHRLLEAGLVDPLLLQGFLGEVRSRRDFDPDVSLALLLVERRVVPAEQLEGLLYGSVVSLEGSASDLLPNRFGEFEVVRELERGGMGAVLEVRGPQGNRLALKTLLPGGASEPELLARFQREAELTARLDHPHVVRIHAAALEASPLYLVIDHLPGGTLQERITRANGLPLEESLGIALKLTSALQHAHARGVLHRDLKPENVLFDDRGEPRIIDWGLARSVAEVSQHLTRTGTLLGTPAYMAPEQALAAAAVGPEADVYSLGAVLFACLCGRPPFKAPQLLQILDQVIHDPPPAPSTLVDLGPQAPAVDVLLGRLLAKEPSARPGLSELGEELRSLARGDAPSSPRPRWLPGLVLGCFVLICAGVALALGTAPDPETLRREYFAWEEGNLSGYSLSVAPVPSAAELKAARERFLELRVSDEQNTLTEQRYSAYAGLLEVLEGRKAPDVSGAPGAVLAAVEAYRQGDLRATQRRAKRALSLAQRGGPERAERAAAQFLLVRSAGDLRGLQRLQTELEIEDGPLREALEARGAELVSALLSDFPRGGETWHAGIRRIGDRADQARSLGLRPQTWWSTLADAAPRWRSQLEKLRRVEDAEGVAAALDRLDPPGVGPELRTVLQGTIDRFAKRSASLVMDLSQRARMHETLAVALRLDDSLAYVDSDYVVTPETRDAACGQHNGLDPGTSPKLSTDCALFALRHSRHLSLSDIRNHLNSDRLSQLRLSRPRPRSAARALAYLFDTSREQVRFETGAVIRKRARELLRLLELEPNDLAPGVRALSQLWLAEHHEHLATYPRVDAGEHFRLAAEWARRSLGSLPQRKLWNSRVQVMQHQVRLAQHRKKHQEAADLWVPLKAQLRSEFEAGGEKGTAKQQARRLALIWVLISEARLRFNTKEFEVALGLAEEASRLAYRRYAWENWLPQSYEIQAVALRALGKDSAAWKALHLDSELFGSSTGYATLALELGVELDKREEVTRAFHASFLRPFPSRERNSRLRNLTLEPAERAEILSLAKRLGYPEPPERYR
jgi:protein kinase-like protein